MKKILILMAGVAILAISCNQNNQVTDESDNSVAQKEQVDLDKKTVEKNIESQPVSEPDKNVEEGNGGKVVMLTTEEFKKKIWNYTENPSSWVYEGDLPCVIDFYADWCKPCKMVAPIMDELAAQYDGKVNIYKVNTDHNRELSSVFQIRSIPTVMYIPAQGDPSMQVGAKSKEAYISTIESFLIN